MYYFTNNIVTQTFYFPTPVLYHYLCKNQSSGVEWMDLMFSDHWEIYDL